MHVGFQAAFQHLGIETDAEAFEQELAYCIDAENLGFDSVWLTEHHFSNYGLIPDPLQVLSHIAAKTSTVKLGTAVVVVPWHDPVRLAEQVILTDHLSGGRLLLGLGRGLAKDEFEGMRVPLEESRSRFLENTRILMHALETGVIEGGPTLELPRRELRPRPYRSFQGRIFSASVSPESSAMVAELGLGMMFIIVKPAEMLAHDVARHQATWQKVRAEGGGTPPQSLVSVVVAVDEDRAYAEDLASRYYNAAHANAVQHYGMDKSTFGKIRGYEFYRNLRVPAGATAGPPVTVIHGNPDDVLEKLAEFKHAANAQGFLTIFHGIPGPDGERNLKCFVKHCLPELKKWPSDPTF